MPKAGGAELRFRQELSLCFAFLKTASSATPKSPQNETRLPCGLLPSQVSELLGRDLSPNDYELLLQLDESVARPTAKKASVDSLDRRGDEDFLGETCVICLHAFEMNDDVTALPCAHFFHRECVSKWLLERCRSCPICGIEALPAEAEM